MSSGLGLAMLSCAWLFNSAALGADEEDPVRSRARALAQAGAHAYAAADYETAQQRLEDAFRLVPVPSLGLWSARALAKVGKLVEAEHRYQAVSRLDVASADPAVQRAAKLDAASELKELSSRIPTLSFFVDRGAPDPVRVELDGAVVPGVGHDLPQRVNPGRHEVVATRGTERTVVILVLAEGQHEEIGLRFSLPGGRATQSQHIDERVTDLEVGASKGLRTAGWLTLAAGGASVAAGMVAYFVSRDERDTVERLGECSTPTCFAESADAHRSYDTWRTLELVGLMSGGLLGAAGVTLLVGSYGTSSAGRQTESVRIGLELGPASAALLGRF